MTKKRIMIVDDHLMVGQSLAHLLQTMDSGIETFALGSIADLSDDLKQGSKYDLILLDYEMPKMNGLDGLKLLKKDYPDQIIGMISGITDIVIIRECIKKGAIGWIPKSMSGEPLIHAIRLMAENVQFIPSEFIFKLSETEDRWHQFDGAEKDVVQQIADGLTDKEIAAQLELPVRTVQHHVSAILKKSECENRVKFALNFSL